MKGLIPAPSTESVTIASVSPIRLLESRTTPMSPATDTLSSEPESPTSELDLAQAGINSPSSEQTKIIGTIALFERFPAEPMSPE
jgi:hypothetical protein